MVKSLRSAWFGMFQQVERSPFAAERSATHERVILPDGQLMYVQTASLAAAKDLLAAQRAVEQRMQAEYAERRAFAAEPTR